MVGTPKLYVFGHKGRESQTYVVEDRGYLTPCWIWQGQLKNGYGLDAEERRVHRVFYERAKGPIPSGLEPDHLCQVKACVNPDHLEAVTHTVNVQRGPHTRLTWEDVRQIRMNYATGMVSLAELGRYFGVTYQMISKIVTGQSWKETPTT